MAKLFNTAKNTDAVTKARETANLSFDEEVGEHTLSIAFCGGKGTGAQVVRASLFDEFVNTLAHYAENGVPKASRPEMNEVDILRASIQVEEDGLISFRTTSGRGAKPTRIHPDQLQGVVNYLRNEVAPTLEKAMNPSDEGSDE